MRYHYEKPKVYMTLYGTTYTCDHELYTKCTLYKINDIGLSVIQQRFDQKTKTTYWTEIDPWLIDDIYLNSNFKTYFHKKAGRPLDGLYPTVTVRQLMWAIKMKPLPRQNWETYFDRKLI
ncbi:MAG: hypothetical protein ACI35S_00530 [Anaeroplasma sp.]